MKIPNYSQQKNMLVFCLTPHIAAHESVATMRSWKSVALRSFIA